MKPPAPTAEEIVELLSFLPRLSRPGYEPIEGWADGNSADRTRVTLSWPEYDDVVEEFMRVAPRRCWADRAYDPTVAGPMLNDPEAVMKADLAQVRSMLTYCVRGERFCTGHWERMITSGKLPMLLRRIAQLAGHGS